MKMPYPQPGFRDYVKMIWQLIRWRFWTPAMPLETPCPDCKYLGNLHNRCDASCRAPNWRCFEYDAAGGSCDGL
jgi:hypothetical protein